MQKVYIIDTANSFPPAFAPNPQLVYALLESQIQMRSMQNTHDGNKCKPNTREIWTSRKNQTETGGVNRETAVHRIEITP